MAIDVSQLQMPPVSPDARVALDLLQCPEPDLKALADTLLRDSILSLTLIKYANSPIHRRSAPVDNVPMAIRVLGLRNIRSAIVMAMMRPLVSGRDPVTRAIWQHCVEISFLCKRLATISRHHEIADEIAFLGLSHDIGMLVLAHNFPDIYSAIIEVSARDQINANRLEETHLGIQHDDLVAHILKDFRLPEAHITLLSAYHGSFCSLEGDPLSIRRAILDLAHHLWVEQPGGRLFYEQIGNGDIAEPQAFLDLDTASLDAVRAEYAAFRASDGH